MLEAVAIRGEDVWEARPLLDAGQAPQAAGDSWLGTGSDGSSGCEAGDPAGVSGSLGFNISVCRVRARRWPQAPLAAVVQSRHP